MTFRHAEAHRLDLYDVDTAARRLTVRLGKGQRDRLVPLTETAAQWITRYLTAARPELAAQWWGKGRRRGQPKLIAPTSALWLAVTGGRPSYQMIADRIRDYALQAEIKASVHTFRHCCAASVAPRRQRSPRATTAGPPRPEHHRDLHARGNLRPATGNRNRR